MQLKIISSRKDKVFMQSVGPLNVLLPLQGNERKNKSGDTDLNVYLLNWPLSKNINTKRWGNVDVL